ncbi:nicotinamide riboside transporter PnuC [Flammeovirga aprica]|uniref:Nicotinamide riboside transporter PnuC n=1 Tax=Flammeovirga aprica JL-4 TaxID=694437 RepID=A0A7X9RS59_9BACT|nr:nicotinamide riboside transporter PnuC [Flammeovirga aprica]NME68598.1 nicotinamide mononucleotide transporter [Flammeovirga aprica JL-4]
MEFLSSIIDINSTFFEVLGYPMSYIEFFGTLSGLISVWLATKANIHTWTIGIINVIAFFLIYYQIQLYSDMFLQVFFFGTSVLGIWQWLKKKPVENDKKIRFLHQRDQILLSVLMIVTTFILGYMVSQIHLYLPKYFTAPASYPYADAFTTVLSIFATFLMAYKRVECWVLWILVDVVCIVLYFQKGVMFISVEYFIFLFIAINGLIQWSKSIQNEKRFSIG